MHFGFIKDVTAKNGSIVVGLDIGSTKICVMVAEVNPFRSRDENNFPANIMGVGTAPSKGIKKGVVINIEQTVEAIREAVQRAEEASGVDIKTVYTGVTGSHIGYISSQGIIAVKEKEIGQKEVDMVIDAARAVAIPFDREILHVVPLEFIVNGQEGITDPRGMVGVRLEAKVQIITGAASSIQNLMKCCQKAGLEALDVVFQPVATADAVLTRDEKELGVALVDIGGGTIDIALYKEGNIFHSAVLAVGGGNFTNDAAIGLRLPFHEAEKIKRKYGCSMLSLVRGEEEIGIETADGKPGRSITRSHLVEILQPRAEELFGLIKEEITGKGHHKLMNAGVVLTGGTVLMEGMTVMAENILELPVKIGSPIGIGGHTDILSNPAYAACAGLVLQGAQEILAEQGLNSGGIFSGIKSKMSGWFRL
ncbi:MAG: cell division protein FtsA [Nitrospirae bacterium]|nr:cell division protein FtsA [Nitrospirota bacterium]